MPAGTSDRAALTSRPGSGLVLHPLLEQLGGVAQPGHVDVGDGRVDGLLIGGLGDGGEGVQHGGVGLPATFRVASHHVGQSSPR